MVGAVIVAMFLAFVTGALARFALPGPDPMPAWLTIAIGLAGTAIGTGIVIGVAGRDAASWSGLASFAAAVALVVVYRRFVQKRPVWGRGAYRFPERGFGIEAYRDRLRRAGIDPDRVGSSLDLFQPHHQPHPQQQEHPPAAASHAEEPRGGDPLENPAHYLGLLEELHDAGVLDDEQYAAARLRLLERLRA